MTDHSTSKTQHRQSVLFIFSSSPHSGTTARDGLDTLLAYSAFDAKVGVIFMGDGVWQLCDGQTSHHAEQKIFARMLQVLPLYDVTNVFIHHRSLNERGLTQGHLLFKDAQIVDDAAITDLLAQYTWVYRF